MRAIENRTLTCDFCGIIPPLLYLPEQHRGAFCEACVADVINPAPPKPVKLAPDGEPVEDDLGVIRKLNAYLQTRPKQPVFCGRGRPRKEHPPEPPQQPHVIQRWKFFSRTDRVRATAEKPFKGVRNIVWAVLRASEGATIGEVLTRCADAGLSEAQAVSILRKMVVVYGVLAIEKAAA